jgi:hypothetical protein
MKECEKYVELLPEFLEGALEGNEAAEVALHLGECAECRDELGFVRNLTTAARQMPQPRPDDTAVLRITEAIRATQARPRGTGYGPVLSVEDLADYLRVDLETLEPYLADIPCFELGGKLLFRRETVEGWVRQREQAVNLGFGAAGGDRATVQECVGIQTGGGQWTL